MKTNVILSIIYLSLLFFNLGAAWGYQEVEVTDGGMIVGSVRFSGIVPQIPAIKVVKNPEFCGPEIQTPILRVNSISQGIKNTIVYIKTIKKGKRLPEKAHIDSVKCLFEPHVAGVVKDRFVAIKNSDPILHNPHTFNERGATVFNVAIPEPGQTVERRMRSGGVIRMQCDLHAHMNSWILSLENPYFSVTDEDGRFEISDIPPGRYELVAWHEGYHMTNWSVYEESVKAEGEEIERPQYDSPYMIEKEIEVKPGKTTPVEFVIQGR